MREHTLTDKRLRARVRPKITTKAHLGAKQVLFIIQEGDAQLWLALRHCRDWLLFFRKQSVSNIAKNSFTTRHRAVTCSVKFITCFAALLIVFFYSFCLTTETQRAVSMFDSLSTLCVELLDRPWKQRDSWDESTVDLQERKAKNLFRLFIMWRIERLNKAALWNNLLIPFQSEISEWRSSVWQCPLYAWWLIVNRWNFSHLSAICRLRSDGAWGKRIRHR